ncbi:hypothetical protein WKI68_05540 [Streptomyces sp. MS1.HAVA.3]|uniref:Uncharacterized protein n=1 Tax=Streptomyces caledonius TaxID=3134107 RepID=A0ABU8TZM7_9ACTN
MESEKDSENKRFLDGMLKKVVVGAGAMAALGVVFVGGKVMIESKNDPEDSTEA